MSLQTLAVALPVGISISISSKCVAQKRFGGIALVVVATLALNGSEL